MKDAPCWHRKRRRRASSLSSASAGPRKFPPGLSALMSTQRLEDAGWCAAAGVSPQLSRKQSSRAEMAAIRQASKELDQELVKAKMELSRRQSSLNADEQASRVSTIAAPGRVAHVPPPAAARTWCGRAR